MGSVLRWVAVGVLTAVAGGCSPSVQCVCYDSNGESSRVSLSDCSVAPQGYTACYDPNAEMMGPSTPVAAAIRSLEWGVPDLGRVLGPAGNSP